MLDDSKGVLTDLSGRTDITQHEVILNTSDQIRNKPYQNPYAVKEAVRRQIQGLFGRLPFGVFCEESWLRFVPIFSYVKMRTPPPCGLFLPSGIKSKSASTLPEDASTQLTAFLSQLVFKKIFEIYRQNFNNS